MIRSRFSTLIAAVIVLSALMACKKKSSSSEGSSSSSTASADSTGIPECDEYLTKYQKCIDDKVPAVARPGMGQAIDKMRATYKQSAANPAAKAGLAMGCKQALETTKTAMAQYNCEW
jgi:cell division protein FtsN